MRVAFIDQWNGESIWVTANSVEIWRLESSWRQHGAPACVGPYSDYFVDFTKEFDVQNGTSSLQFVIASNLKTGVNIASFGFTTMTVEVFQTGDYVPSMCQYNVETDVWYEINMENWQPNQLATLECADGTKVACGDWFNRYACQMKVGVPCPAPRKLLVMTPPQSDAQPNVTCCSLGKSCDANASPLPGSGSITPELTCEYLYNKLEDTSFVDIKVNDMTKTVRLECANGRLFKCIASQWGKYTCSFKDRVHVNRNPDNILCPEPRNVIIDGQCCNLGKGCEKPSNYYGVNDPYYNGTLSEQTSSLASAPTLITIAAFCGLVAIAAVVCGAVVMYKRAKAGRSMISRLP
jgi:hypothetical protein